MAAADDVQRVLSLLKRAIRSSGSSQKEVDRKIGVQPGYLSQVMIGRLDLKLKHLLRALDAIEVDPAGFFSLAFPAGGGAETGGDDLLKILPRVKNEPIADADLERLVARALAEELGLPVDELRRAPSMR
jgi:transcriptional regulator with XRE-family HTH domain